MNNAGPSFNRRTFLRRLTCAISGATLLRPRLSGMTLAGTSPRIKLGIDVLEISGFALLRGKRVGLLTHPAGVNRFGKSTIQVLREAPEVRLVALFGPEHGIYGDEKANIPVADKIDSRTGLPAFSLYGQFRRPTPEMLARIDIMVIDLQDIGSRSYTYVSCMRYVMEEAFKAGKEVVVLDRPNPLGGLKVDGPPLEEKWMSYVGAFRVPYVHGLTIGELANYAKRTPGVLKVPDNIRRRGRLHVIPMYGWQRSMMWTQTGLKWIPTSPAIPDLSAVLGYPMTGLGAQLGGFAHGYGTHLPFRLVQFPATTPEVISRALGDRGINGLSFPIISFEINAQARRATYVRVTNWASMRPTELSLHMMALACLWNRENPFAAASDAQKTLFNKHVGDSSVLEYLIQSGADIPIPRILSEWGQYNDQFRRASQDFRLYHG